MSYGSWLRPEDDPMPKFVQILHEELLGKWVKYNKFIFSYIYRESDNGASYIYSCSYLYQIRSILCYVVYRLVIRHFVTVVDDEHGKAENLDKLFLHVDTLYTFSFSF